MMRRLLGIDDPDNKAGTIVQLQVVNERLRATVSNDDIIDKFLRLTGSGKDIEGIAWKLVKPGADRPFRTTQEEA
jgi:hypothetical protein